MVTPETLTDEMVRALRDSRPVTEEFKPVYDDCVRSLGTEPVTGMPVLPWDRRSARQRICAAINARAKETP